MPFVIGICDREACLSASDYPVASASHNKPQWVVFKGGPSTVPQDASSVSDRVRQQRRHASSI